MGISYRFVFLDTGLYLMWIICLSRDTMHFSNHRRDSQPNGRSREMTLARFTKIKLQIQNFIDVAQFLEEKLKMVCTMVNRMYHNTIFIIPHT